MATYNRSKRNLKDWRKKVTNSANLKYSKDVILNKFEKSEAPVMINIPEVLFSDYDSPILAKTHTFVCENSRKNTRVEKKEKKLKNEVKARQVSKEKKEKKEEVEFKDKKQVRFEYKIEITQENDEEYEDSEENIDIDSILEQNQEKEEITFIKYDEELVMSHVNQGNPFAVIILESGEKEKGKIIPKAKALEKVWFYKDPFFNVHGPFNSLEMFNWTAAGYFNDSLKVAYGNKDFFYCLRMFINIEKKISL